MLSLSFHTEIKNKMNKAIEALKKDFNLVRTGRANPMILDGVIVDYYGVPTPLNQVGNITVPEPQLIVIAPWEKNLLKEIEKSLLKSDLGMTPQNDGNVIRLPIPPLDEQRRKELVKKIKKMCEDAKISIRNTRRDGNESLKSLEKEKELSKDDQKKNMEIIQKLTDEKVKEIDNLSIQKEKELMEI